MTTFLESPRPTPNGQNPKGSTPDLTVEEEFEKTQQIQEAIAPSQGTSNNDIEFAFWLKTQRDSLTNNRDGEKAIASETTRLANSPSSSRWPIIAVAYNSYARRYRESSVQVLQFMHDLMERELNALSALKLVEVVVITTEKFLTTQCLFAAYTLMGGIMMVIVQTGKANYLQTLANPH